MRSCFLQHACGLGSSHGMCLLPCTDSKWHRRPALAYQPSAGQSLLGGAAAKARPQQGRIASRGCFEAGSLDAGAEC